MTRRGFGLMWLLALMLLAATGCRAPQAEAPRTTVETPPPTSAPEDQPAPVSAAPLAPATPSGEETPPPPVAPATEPGAGLKLELGCQIDTMFSLLDARVWFARAFGAEVIFGAVIVPFQITARGLWRALETDKASLYVAGGVTWREGFLVPSIAAGTVWSISDSISVSFEVGLAYTGPGGWLPPGPPPFIGGGASFLSLIGIGVLYHLP